MPKYQNTNDEHMMMFPCCEVFMHMISCPVYESCAISFIIIPFVFYLLLFNVICNVANRALLSARLISIYILCITFF
jgi:hypothetical protein